MPSVIRKGIDSHIGHASPTPSPFHKSKYNVAGQGKVTAEGGLVVTTAGSTSCGDDAVGGSSKVTAGGYPVHRTGDATSGHGSWVANAASSGSTKVTAGG
jgi:uncharacterized Zn-binding protein involved in type VI secretion